MSKSAAKKNAAASAGKIKTTIDIDPSIVRYTHSRIRPYFSGCGKRLEETIKEIVDGVIAIEDLPVITVVENDGEFFALNNRRLYVIKHIQSLGLLKKSTVQVLRKPALERELTRYTAERCSLQARVMLEKDYSDDEDGNIAGKAESKPEEGLDSSTDLLAGAITEGVEGLIVTEGTTSASTVKVNTKSNDKAKPVKAKTKPIPADVMKELKDITKLVSKGKTKVALSQIDEWVMAGKINDAQRDEICQIVGLPVN